MGSRFVAIYRIRLLHAILNVLLYAALTFFICYIYAILYVDYHICYIKCNILYNTSIVCHACYITRCGQNLFCPF